MNHRASNLLAHFLDGTDQTVSGARIGLEIETDFIDEEGRPISPAVTEALLASRNDCPFDGRVSLELGRQKIELAMPPSPSFSAHYDQTRQALDWLYGQARTVDAFPRFAPDFHSDEPLLYITNDRDRHWVELDGTAALEHLCRCSSVQFTVDVNPQDAIPWVNALWGSRLHEVDYALNDRYWRAYLRDSQALHPPLRYAGPEGFQSLESYVEALAVFPALMGDTGDVDLFLRSVWWHHRLRRHGDTLCLEIRPTARRGDEAIPGQWHQICQALGLSNQW